MTMRMSLFICWLLALIFTADAHAGGLRCGTKLVITGDPVSHLLRTCGQPAMKYIARANVKEGGRIWCGSVSENDFLYVPAGCVCGEHVTTSEEAHQLSK